MERKTFISREEANKYKNDRINEGSIALISLLGERFRVYVITEAMFEEIKGFRGDEYTNADAERYLRNIAWREKEAVDNALSLRKMMLDNSLYTDYESTIDAAHILESNGKLKLARDVFDFIDNPHELDKAMNQIIEETLNEYDYEGMLEVAKD